jgi:hypothetical protein
MLPVMNAGKDLAQGKETYSVHSARRDRKHKEKPVTDEPVSRCSGFRAHDLYLSTQRFLTRIACAPIMFPQVGNDFNLISGVWF